MIGRSWAMLFAAADYNVVVHDKEPKQLTDAMTEIRAQLDQLEKLGLLRGHLTVGQQLANISTTESIQECVSRTVYIQVCIPLFLLRQVDFSILVKWTGPFVI